MTISRDDIISELTKAGFNRLEDKKNLFITSSNSIMSPAFIPRILRRRGECQISGGIGLYFNEFEEKWESSLSESEKRVDETLPLIISIENFEELNDKNIFSYTSHMDDLPYIAREVFCQCSLLPKSVDDFCISLQQCNILGKRVVEFFHYFSPIDNSNIYFDKSASFFCWVRGRYPELGERLFSCVDLSMKYLILSRDRLS